MRLTSGTTGAPDRAPDFLAAVDACLGTIQRHPEAFPLIDATMRRALVRRFPYAIFYEIGTREIVVYGLFHGARDPQTWRRRRDG
jgi:plasmid stabilization system protein ParE